MSLRVGHGVDAHRLVPGRPLMIGCVAVPLALNVPSMVRVAYVLAS